MPRPARPTRTEAARITRRLIGCVPASVFEMQTLTRLSNIQVSRDVPTAAVECTRRPRLLINPDFVKKYCPRDEHLFLLVMHELWHVMLAHTRMYPRMTQAQNIAFDAIINANLMREFSGPEYRGFFDEVNPADKFPSCLLRPPEGWPHDPQYPDVGPPGTKDILMRLYPPRGRRWSAMPLYEEVLNLLLRAGMIDMPFLIGNHGSGDQIHDPYMKEMMKQVSEKWPRMKLDGRGEGGKLGRQNIQAAPTGEDVRRVFARTLRICLGPRAGRLNRRGRVPVQSTIGNGVLPNPKDRMSHARRRLGGSDILYTQPGTIKARLPEKPSMAHVYLDVSGSMNHILPYLIGLIRPYVANRLADAFQFSTEVKPMPWSELRQGKLTTTGGTNINCVLHHLLNHEPQVQRVLILTDGEVGPPMRHLVGQLQERDMRLHVVMPNDGNLHNMMRKLATSVVTLPPLH